MRCGVCGAETPPPFNAPPAELAPDLDLRPGEPTRSTLRRWLQTCVSCRATAPDLAMLAPELRAVVESETYLAETNPFLRWAALQPQAEAWLQAAWFADDRNDETAATEARLKAVELWGKSTNTASALRLLDVLRRAGKFADAAALAERLADGPIDENSARIVAFQQARVHAGDNGRHLISSALRPPARTPHVAHGKAASGFWGRLLGR